MPDKPCKVVSMRPQTRDGTRRLSLSELLRQRILESGLPYIELERRTGVIRQTLMRFVKGDTLGVRLATVEILMDYFGLRVVEAKPKAARKPKKQAKGR